MSFKLENTKLKAAAYKSRVPDAKKTLFSQADKVKETAPYRMLALVSVLSFWIMMSVNNNNLFLNEALLSSAIILGLAFMKGAGQYNDPARNN